jgi:hypothetical protein
VAKNNGKQGTVRPIRPEFTTQAAQLTITAYTDRPPALQCTGDLLTALRLLTAGLALVGNSVEQMVKPPAKAEADVVDKKREYLGPREG